MKVSLVILTYNEIVGLRQLFNIIPQESVAEVFAVDGGSTDGTIDFLKNHGIKTYVQEKRGRGEAFRLAFEKAQGDALIFFGPDGNEDPADIPKFKPLIEQGYDMVIATRMKKGSRNEEDEQFFKFRKWANKGFNAIANIVWNRGPFISDVLNGFRAITKKTWREIIPDSSGYTIEYQSTIRCFKRKLKIAEFITREGNRIEQREGAPSISTGIVCLKLFLKELFIGNKFL